MDRFTIGDIRVHRIEEWRGAFSPPGELFQGFDARDWQRLEDEFVPDYYDPVSGKLFAFLQSWVLDTGEQRILFDTGAGNDKDRLDLPIFGNLQTDFLGRLAAAGFQPEDIDTVVCSHIHVDHVGWNTRLVDGRWEPTFRNARYVLPVLDRDYWDPLIDTAGPGIVGHWSTAGCSRTACGRSWRPAAPNGPMTGSRCRQAWSCAQAPATRPAARSCR